MATTNEVSKIYDTILSIPGMNDLVKIQLKISRKNILLLNRIIEQGVSVEGDSKNAGILSSIAPENIEELKSLASDCLQKAGLIELNEKLKAIEIGK